MWVILSLFIFLNPANDTIDDLAWLTGSWVSEDGLTEEHWTTPAGHIILGMNRMQRPPKNAFFEYMRIEEREDGVYYVASPLGRTSVAFKMTELKDGRAVFENEANDYPQKIIYMRKDAGIICATISAIDDTKPNSWCFKKMK